MSQTLFDLMFQDMDQTLRELGVGDLSVGKKIRQMAEAFYGRAVAYERGLGADRDGGALETALLRNLYGGTTPPADAVAGLVAYVRRLDAALAGQSLAALREGGLSDLPSRQDGVAA